MRIHLAIAAVILVAGMALGVWFERPSHSSKDPVDLRNDIAQSDAVTATFVQDSTVRSNAPGPPSTLTFIRGKGWIWTRPAGPAGTPAGSIVATPSQTLTAVAPGCYIGIPAGVALPAPSVPGVNLARDLNHVPDFDRNGRYYSYRIIDPSGGMTLVNEDLGSIAADKSFTAQMSISGPSASELGDGLFTIRRSTDAERDAATKLLTSAHASPVASMTIEQRVLAADAPGQSAQPAAITLISPKDCPADLTLDPALLAPGTSDAFFREAGGNRIFGVPIGVEGAVVTVHGVLPVLAPIDAPSKDIEDGLTEASPADIVLKPGVVFALPFNGMSDGSRLVMAVTACKPAAWFPCNG